MRLARAGRCYKTLKKGKQHKPKKPPQTGNERPRERSVDNVVQPCEAEDKRCKQQKCATYVAN
jgi:hypothetical protein